MRIEPEIYFPSNLLLALTDEISYIFKEFSPLFYWILILAKENKNARLWSFIGFGGRQ